MNFKILGAMVTLSFSLMAGKAFAQDNYSVLAYHSVVDESAPKSQQLFISQTIPVQKLISHFNWLKDNGYNVISWQQVIDAEKGKGTLPPKAVVLSFDDGYETMYSVVYPLLKAYQYPAVFAPVTKWINTPAGGKIDYGNQMLDRATFFSTWAQISEMRRSGLVEIASHSYDSHHGVIANPTGSQQPAMLVLIKIYVALPMILQNRLVKHQALLFGLTARLTISRLNKQNLLECLTTLRLKKKLTALEMHMLVVS